MSEHGKPWLSRAETRALVARLRPTRLLLRACGEIGQGSPLGREALTVLAANAAILALALIRGLALAELLWFFFAQSLFQFLLTLRRIRHLTRADPSGFRLPPELPAERALVGLKVFLGIALALAGGFAHWIYATMLLAITAGWPTGNPSLAWLMLGILLIQSLLGHRRQLAEDRAQPPLLAALLITPFVALVFVQGTILLGALLGAGAAGTIAILLLKTAFELASLDFERELAAVLRQAEAARAGRAMRP